MATEKQNKTYEVFVHSTAPMGAISFDKIKTSDYLPAMREAIADHKKEIDHMNKSISFCVSILLRL